MSHRRRSRLLTGEGHHNHRVRALPCAPIHRTPPHVHRATSAPPISAPARQLLQASWKRKAVDQISLAIPQPGRRSVRRRRRGCWLVDAVNTPYPLLLQPQYGPCAIKHPSLFQNTTTPSGGLSRSRHPSCLVRGVGIGGGSAGVAPRDRYTGAAASDRITGAAAPSDW